ncbi:chemotaxis protein CheW [Paenibacillus aurantiacus]|uniref:Chemotaxis protein CheA n=1 Tax=Paenibacillus aurantiacus TaxID=1936118 RepID=A0ABV5KQ33_9BACL
MTNPYITEQMVEMFIYETTQNIEMLEQTIVHCEAEGFDPAAVNEILRNMHTIKGSSAMMCYTTVATLSHSLEDLFFFLREQKPAEVDYTQLSDMVLEGIDFIKVELHKIKSGDQPDGEAEALIGSIHRFLAELKAANHPGASGSKLPSANTAAAASQPPKAPADALPMTANSPSAPADIIRRQAGGMASYEALLHFVEGCEMENVRAFGVVHALQQHVARLSCFPADYLENEESIRLIREQGFVIRFQSDESYETLHTLLEDTLFLKSVRLTIPGQAQQSEFNAYIRFQPECEMENIRAFGIVHALKDYAWNIACDPANYLEDEAAAELIRAEGFTMRFRSDVPYARFQQLLDETLFLSHYELHLVDDPTFALESAAKQESALPVDVAPAAPAPSSTPEKKKQPAKKESGEVHGASHGSQSLISVNVDKLDRLMDLVGEMVIAEAMVTQNPDLHGLQLDRFHKASQLLHKITSELQDVVMSIRMVPLTATFQKMHRIVRDMCKNLGKEVQLKLIGEETEVDKNVIQHISDPLMHLIRNSVDHGIELPEDREAAGKSRSGTVTLEARNSGGDVYVYIKDDGKGLSKEKLLEKARKNGLLTKPENEMSDKEIYGLIFLPGFSTKENISEYSGRGVGMDVVSQNISAIGGTIAVDSAEGSGTTITLKIPLTLAIIDGMTIRVGNSRYTVPTVSIVESFRPRETDIIRDPDDREMIMVRGQCYPILRLHERYGVKSDTTLFSEGILIMVEHDGQSFCLFADELLGQQQVVVKALPAYIKRMRNIQGLAGCTLLGDGSISLILDPGALAVSG